MKSISLHQPWAGLIFIPTTPPAEGMSLLEGFQTGGLVAAKTHETRHWPYPPAYEGERIAIHAAKRNPRPAEMFPFLDCGLVGHFQFHRGAYLGTVRLAGCFRTDEREPSGHIDRLAGDWTPGRYAWALEDVQPLAKPIPAIGKQGWWSIDPAILEGEQP